MKTIFFTTLLFLSLSLKAQENMSFLVNKTFTAKIGSICEETNIPDSCAGKQIYLVLEFKKEEVSILEKYISSCNKETTNNLGVYKWLLLDNNEVNIDYNPTTQDFFEGKIGFSMYMEDLILKLSNQNLLGIRKKNDRITEYTFSPINLE